MKQETESPSAGAKSKPRCEMIRCHEFAVEEVGSGTRSAMLCGPHGEVAKWTLKELALGFFNSFIREA